MIAISIGHYLAAPGACWKGQCEYELATQWAQLIYDELKFRTDARLIVPGKLPYKVDQINILNAALAMEIHFNACGGCGASGTETLYAPGSVKGKQAAEIVQHGMVQAMRTKDRGAKEGWFRMDRPGIVDYPGDIDGDEQPDYFLRKTNCPAIIIEPEFIHNYYKYEDDIEDICSVIAGQLMMAEEAIK